MIAGRLGYTLVRALPKRALTQAAGVLASLDVPPALRRPVYSGYAAVVGADLGEVDAPLADFDTFNAFFARRLRDGARPISAAPVVSPADGRVDAVGVVSGGRAIQAKGIDYSIAELVGDSALAASLEGATFATVYLSPADYHRVHAPLSGRVVRVTHIPGELWPVNSLSVPYVDGLFRRNERVVFELRDANDNPAVAVMVAATVVGAVEVARAGVEIRRTGGEPVRTDTAGWSVEQGDELGAFLLGSTVVLAYRDGGRGLCVSSGQRIRMGEALAG
ncbi:MAG: phosphatidylserine decarboxylase [Myxococcales bacterium]|nr:phosphatidylserine decarboxylase [Myxococcales bacterium]MCB9533298.1 phosphatidylserine decarboxylase [Myxococcales bacterium]